MGKYAGCTIVRRARAACPRVPPRAAVGWPEEMHGRPHLEGCRRAWEAEILAAHRKLGGSSATPLPKHAPSYIARAGRP